MERCDSVVIGAGVIGLAVARALAMSGRDPIIIERQPMFGMETSSRNSEVIHAGIYYPQGSNKARLCVAGRNKLYEYCRERHIGHRQCGKLIVAPDETDVARLEGIAARAGANGVSDLVLLSGEEARKMEPALHCAAALHSPSTGIIDVHELMLSLLGDAEMAGAVIAYNTEISNVTRADGEIILSFSSGAPDLAARLVVNCAGHDAPRLARQAGLEAPASYLAKGTYFTLSGKCPFHQLIYPTPEPGGLGVHLTLDMGGQARVGPDVEWVDHPDYNVDAAKAEEFYKSVQRWWPDIPEGSLVPGYAGLRPKIAGPDEPDADFQIIPGTRQMPMINLFGIESPGITSALAIAEEVGEMAGELADA